MGGRGRKFASSSCPIGWQASRSPARKDFTAAPHTEESVGWTTRRHEYPLPAKRGEGQGEGRRETVEIVFGQCLQGFPSLHSSVAGRGRRHSVEAALVTLSLILRTAR